MIQINQFETLPVHTGAGPGRIQAEFSFGRLQEVDQEEETSKSSKGGEF